MLGKRGNRRVDFGAHGVDGIDDSLVADRRSEWWQQTLERGGTGLGDGMILIAGTTTDANRSYHPAIPFQWDATSKNHDLAVNLPTYPSLQQTIHSGTERDHAITVIFR